MTSALAPDAPLPVIREEIQIHEGARNRDGTLAWLLYDPLRARYFQIDKKSLELFKLWHIGTPQGILDGVPAKPGLKAEYELEQYSLADIEELTRFLYKNSLTQDPPGGDVQFFTDQAKATHRSLWESAVHNYLFFRVPFLRPHSFLKKTVHFTDIFFSKPWMLTTLFFFILGGYLALRQWDSFIHTFLHFFNMKGLALYFFALALVKFCHEFGHAYTATRYGCRVSTMGVAFLVMFPVLFTDTTDSWKLKSHRQRLNITAAGVIVELTIAIYATFLWAFLPDGVWRSAAFFIATTSWIMSLAVNLNPLMRFDGYHFLSDLIKVQNLQARSFALGRWKLRELLFDFNDPAPEPLTPSMRSGLIFYSWLTWIYRFFLFLGIALLVHALFFKVLGIILFIIEISWFIMVPIMNEIREWKSRTSEIISNRRVYYWAFGAVALMILFIVPWQSTIRIPAVLEAREQTALHVRDAARINQVNVENGSLVKKGDLLLSLQRDDLDTLIAQESKRIHLLQARLDRIAVDYQDLEQKLVLQQELVRARETLEGYQAQAKALTITADFDGVITDLDPALHSGRWINSQIPLGNLISQDHRRIRGYVYAENIERIASGAKATFIPEQHELKKIRGNILKINETNATTISLPELTSRFGGAIAVSESKDTLTPLGAWYTVIMTSSEKAKTRDYVVRGEIHAKGKPESFAARVWRRVIHIAIRETTL